MSSPNGLICFTNCLLPTEDGSLVEQDLWIDERRGVILDAQVSVMFADGFVILYVYALVSKKTFFKRRQRPDRVIDLGGNILRYALHVCYRFCYR